MPIEAGVSAGLRAGAAAPAFDVLVAPIDGDLRLCPRAGAASGFGAAAGARPARLARLSTPFGRVVRGAVVVPAAAAQVARHVLPEAGARAPSAAGLRWEVPAIDPAGRRPSHKLFLPPATRIAAPGEC